MPISFSPPDLISCTGCNCYQRPCFYIPAGRAQQNQVEQNVPQTLLHFIYQ